MHYIIGDVHGCFYTLEQLVSTVYKEDPKAQLVFVGDYVDRGLWSNKVIDFMIGLQENGAVCLRGNHDDVIGWILNSQSASDLKEFVRGPVNLLNVASWWLSNGLYSTIQSYFKPEHGVIGNILDEFRSIVPKKHKDFLNGLRLYWEIDTHFAGHAFLNPSQELPRKIDFLRLNYNELLWSRFPTEYVDTGYGRTPSGISGAMPVWDKIGVFGHTPVENYGSLEPIRFGNLRLIDTGVFLGRAMTAYCCEQDNFISQSTDPRDIMANK